VQMDRLEEMRKSKIEICKAYDNAFSNLGRISIPYMKYDSTFPFMYVVLAED
jgi:hypothetical protein